MRRGIAALAIGAFLALAGPAGAVTLVNPDGSPVGGQWQQWADEMRVPSYQGTVIFQPVAFLCQYPNGAVVLGCSEVGPVVEPGTPYQLAASDRHSLYFELGHIFDWSTLTLPERRHFARLWHERRSRWWDSLESLDRGSEDGLQATFAGTYADCAGGGWAARVQRAICRHIRSLAR